MEEIQLGSRLSFAQTIARLLCCLAAFYALIGCSC